LTEEFVAGIASSPHGIKGFIKIRPLSGEMDHLLALKSVRIRLGSQEKVYVIEESQEVHAAVLMKFQGIDSPEDAKKLSGGELLVDRSQAAPLRNDEYYIEDLKGVKVHLGGIDGAEIGEITDIMEGGGAELAEIRLLSGEKKLVPFRNEFFGRIDTENKKAVLLSDWILE
jgi:16S rRNA processing protein RimM